MTRARSDRGETLVSMLAVVLLLALVGPAIGGLARAMLRAADVQRDATAHDLALRAAVALVEPLTCGTDPSDALAAWVPPEGTWSLSAAVDGCSVLVTVARPDGKVRGAQVVLDPPPTTTTVAPTT